MSTTASGSSAPEGVPDRESIRLRDLTPLQRRSGIAAWLGWLFDGLDGTLYVLVATPLVAQLLHSAPADPRVKEYSAYIQAAFLLGWALGGAVFGRIGDRVGRSRTLMFTILTYALCTGLSALAQTWQQLLFLRFLAALGIGGEWAAGSSLVAETWPRRWRPWVSAALQTAYQCGLLLAAFASSLFATDPHPQHVFLIGVLPALIVVWIRYAIPEPEEWQKARAAADQRAPGIADLFRGSVRRTTILTILLCSICLTIVWALVFWFPQQLQHLPDVARLPRPQIQRYVAQATALVTVVAILGNFFAALMARLFGYRIATAMMFLGGFVTMLVTYGVPRDHISILCWAPWTHFFVQGVFGLFPLYIPPLFPTLLRTTGAGFCYNIGRIVAAVGTLLFGVYAPVADFRLALVYVGCLYLPALILPFLMPVSGD